MFVKNISDKSVLARVLGKKRVIEADEIVEMSDEEVENSLSMYPKIFAVVENSDEMKKFVQETEEIIAGVESGEIPTTETLDGEEINLNDMTKPQLKAYAEKMGITLNDKKKKEEMLLDLSVELKKIEEMQTADIL